LLTGFSRRNRDYSKMTRDIFPDAEKVTDFPTKTPFSIALLLQKQRIPMQKCAR
jgi:hypothetical protein